MKITSTDKKVSIEASNGTTITYPLNYLGYQRTDNGVTLLRGTKGLFTAPLSQVTVNGTQATPDNIDELLEPLFKLGSDEGDITLPINISDVSGLQDSLDDKVNISGGITNNEIAENAAIDLSKTTFPFTNASNGRFLLASGGLVWANPMTQDQIDTGGDNNLGRTISANLLRANLALKQDKLPTGVNGQFLRVGADGKPAWVRTMTQGDIDTPILTGGMTVGPTLLKSNLDTKQDKLPTGLNNQFLFNSGGNAVWANANLQIDIDAANTTAKTISGNLLKTNLDKKQDKLPTGTSGTFLRTDASGGLSWIGPILQSDIDTSNRTAKIISGELLKANLDKISRTANRNIILNSGEPITNSTDYQLKTYKTSMDLIEGQTYTVVLKGKTSGTQRVDVFLNRTSSRVGYIRLPTEGGVGSITFVAPAIIAGRERDVYIYNYPLDTSATNPASIEWITLYEGAITPALDWVPAPEDLLSKQYPAGDGSMFLANDNTYKTITGGGTVIEDTLTSTSKTNALSANMGRELNKYVGIIDAPLTDGGYWDANLNLVTGTNNSYGSIDISPYYSQYVEFRLLSQGVCYCGYRDASGNVTATFQIPAGAKSSTLIIPYGAKTLYYSHNKPVGGDYYIRVRYTLPMPAPTTSTNGVFLYTRPTGYTLWERALTQTDIDNNDSTARIVSGALLKQNLDRISSGISTYYSTLIAQFYEIAQEVHEGTTPTLDMANPTIVAGAGGVLGTGSVTKWEAPANGVLICTYSGVTGTANVLVNNTSYALASAIDIPTRKTIKVFTGDEVTVADILTLTGKLTVTFYPSE